MTERILVVAGTAGEYKQFLRDQPTTQPLGTFSMATKPDAARGCRWTKIRFIGSAYQRGDIDDWVDFAKLCEGMYKTETEWT